MGLLKRFIAIAFAVFLGAALAGCQSDGQMGGSGSRSGDSGSGGTTGSGGGPAGATGY
ncbi:MAG TPA: hypothetical protein VF203_00035 [Burkholderiales bacterium]